MNANRVVLAIALIAAVAVAVATTSFAAAPRLPGPTDDFALRHPAGLDPAAPNLAAFYRGSDYAQRHPELSRSGSRVESADYFLRHPELIAVDRSDLFLRHPQWTMLPPVMDSSDYILRHPELISP